MNKLSSKLPRWSRIRETSKSIQDLQRSLREIEVKLNDLYLIEQARLSREIAAQRTREVEFEADNGLE